MNCTYWMSRWCVLPAVDELAVFQLTLKQEQVNSEPGWMSCLWRLSCLLTTVCDLESTWQQQPPTFFWWVLWKKNIFTNWLSRFWEWGLEGGWSAKSNNKTKTVCIQINVRCVTVMLNLNGCYAGFSATRLSQTGGNIMLLDVCSHLFSLRPNLFRINPWL